MNLYLFDRENMLSGKEDMLKILINLLKCSLFKRNFIVVLALNKLVLCVSLVTIKWNILVNRLSLFLLYWISEFYAFLYKDMS